MSSAYFHDNSSTENGDKRPYSIFCNDLKNITPGHIAIDDIIPVRNGFIVKYPNDKDVNHILDTEFQNKCNAKNLAPELSNDTRKQRAVILKDISYHIFSKSKGEISSEISRNSNHNPLALKPFCSNKTNRKYIMLLAESYSSRDEIIALNSLTLFNENITVELPISQNQQPRGPPTGHDITWPRDLRRPSMPPQDRSSTFMRHPAPPPPGLSPWNQNDRDKHWPKLPVRSNNFLQNGRPPKLEHEPEMKLYSYTLLHLIDMLNQGKEHPFDLVNNINATLTLSWSSILRFASSHFSSISQKMGE